MQASAGNTLALQVDAEGNVRYDAIAHQGQRSGKFIQSQFKDLVPLAHRKDLDDEQELNYRGICGAIVAAGFQGFIAQEFVPKGDPVKAMEEAFRICAV